MEGYEDPFNRRFYPWGEEDGDLLAFHRNIARLRKEEKALRLGDTAVTAPDDDTLVIRRTLDGDVLDCILTRKEASLPDGCDVLFSHGLTGSTLSPYGFAVYRTAEGAK